MRGARRHFSVLYTGIPAFYARLDWGHVGEGSRHLPAHAAPKLGAGRTCITHIPIEKTPPAFAHIFARSCGQRPISLLRSHAYWRSWPLWGKGNLWFGLLDDQWTVASKDGKIVGYGGIQRSKDSVAIVEACCLPGHEDVLFDLCDVFVTRCRQAGGELIELDLPSDHPLVARLAPLTKMTLNQSPMVRIIDLPGLIHELRRELDERSLRLSGPVRIRLESSLGSLTLSATPGAVTFDESGEGPRAELTPAGLGSLLLGFRSSVELAKAGEIQAASSTLEVLDLLFPRLNSHYWRIDHF